MTMMTGAPLRICPTSPARPCFFRGEAEDGRPEAQTPTSGDQQDWDPKDRRLYIFGALRAALLIALVYAVGFGLIIGLLLLIWKH